MCRCDLPAKCRRCVCNRYEVALELGALVGEKLEAYTGLTAAELVKVIP